MTQIMYSRMVFVLAVLSAWGLAMGQYQVQQGRLLDANNRLGSGGLNYAQPNYNFNAGNRLMTGNVAGGQSFRGISPVGSPNSMFLGGSLIDPTSLAAEAGTSQLSSYALPSAQLDAFRRDSFNLQDYQNQQYGLGGQVRGFVPYYSMSSTVTNTGNILAGRNRIGTSQVYTPYQALGAGVPTGYVDPYAASTRTMYDGTSLAVSSRLLRKVSGGELTGDVNDRLLQSRLFRGAVRQVPLTELYGQRVRDEALGADVTGSSQQAGRVDLRTQTFGPMDTRVEGTDLLDRRVEMRVESGTGLDRILERAAADGEWQSQGVGQGFTTPAARMGQDVTHDRTGAWRGSTGGTLAGASDVFAKMRVIGRDRTRLASPYGRAGQQSQVALVPKSAAPVIPAPGLPTSGAELMMAGQEPVAIQTFVGTQNTVVNDWLARSEEELQASKFYRAAESYQFTRSMAPNNPLPILGNAMALLAAGDYLASVSDLFEAIRLFDSLSEFRIDLKSFVTDLDVLDRRRADLEARLEVAENYRLRFLLGWAEYSSGLQDIGLSNMEKAIATALPDEPRTAGPGSGQMTTEETMQLRAVQHFVEALKVDREIPKEPIQVPTK